MLKYQKSKRGRGRKVSYSTRGVDLREIIGKGLRPIKRGGGLVS